MNDIETIIRRAAEEAVARAIAELNRAEFVPVAWLDYHQAATYLGIPRRKLEQICARGEGPKSHARTPRRTRFHIADLDAWQRTEGYLSRSAEHRGGDDGQESAE